MNHALLYGIILFGAFLAFYVLLMWSICSATRRANHEAELDVLWADDDELELSA